MLKIRMLKNIITRPEDTCASSDGKPSERLCSVSTGANRSFPKRKLFFPQSQCSDITAILTTGETPVARIAPRIPSFIGKMST